MFCPGRDHERHCSILSDDGPTSHVPADAAAARFRAELGIVLYQERTESAVGAQVTPVLRGCGHHDGCEVDQECSDVAVCPCGEEHVAVETAYGVRAQCDELGVRWTATTAADPARLGLPPVAVVVQHRVWVAEPYGTMATRSTEE